MSGYRFYALAPGADADSLLLHITSDGVSLPWVELAEDPGTNASDVMDAFAARYGLRLTKRLHVARWEVDGESEVCALWATELHDSAALLEGVIAVTVDAVLDRLDDSALREALMRWQADEAAPHPDAEPWSRPGWYAEVVAWLDIQLAAHGMEREGDARQIKVWPLSCVLEAPTNGGRVYLKAVPRVFMREPAITQYLAERYPDDLPPVLAVDTQRGWTLMRDHGAQDLATVTERALWTMTVQRYGAMQVALIPQIDDLLRLGCDDRRLTLLPAHTAGLVASCRVLLPHAAHHELVDAAERVMPSILATARALDALGMAPSLVHSDFHPRNIGIAGDRPIFFDWTDAAVSHPLLDLALFLETGNWHSPLIQQSPDLTPQLADAYLTAFRTLYAPDVLMQALALAKPVMALYITTSYVWISESFAPDDRSSVEGGLVYWLKRMVEYAADAPPVA